MSPPDDRRALRWVLMALVGLLALSGVVGHQDLLGPLRGSAYVDVSARSLPTTAPTPLPTTPSPVAATPTAPPVPGATTTPTHAASPPPPPATLLPPQRPRYTLPKGGTKIFGANQFLVAYYGTANSGSLGVLGETSPDVMDSRLRAAAAPFAGRGRPIQTVYELIVTVVDGSPGDDGSFSHDIAKADVKRYIAAAHRHQALLLLDLQPGRSDFLTVAKRWAWALKDPWVGLALDPEWRMGPHEIPARVVGHVKAKEINAVSLWLANLVTRDRLPEKLFMLHEFRTSMIEHIGGVKARPGLAMVQHVDGFGTPGQKLSTYLTVERSDKFLMGYKLFYHQDIHRLNARGVLAIRPRVRFVSFQ